MDYRRALLSEGVDEETVDKFLAYHRGHPAIWEEFEAIALELISAGAKRYGAKAIAEIIRFRRTIEKRGSFKVGNNYPAYYARIFEIKHPEFKGFFEKREIHGLRAGVDG